jgi:hypothetical protein
VTPATDIVRAAARLAGTTTARAAARVDGTTTARAAARVDGTTTARAAAKVAGTTIAMVRVKAEVGRVTAGAVEAVATARDSVRRTVLTAALNAAQRKLTLNSWLVAAVRSATVDHLVVISCACTYATTSLRWRCSKAAASLSTT